MTDISEVPGITVECQRIIGVTQAAWDTWYRTGVLPPASETAQLRSDFGAMSNYQDQIRQAANDVINPPVPVPPPDPTPTTYQGFAVTYAGHDPARDCYLGTSPAQKEWGRHDGLPILAPAPGRVELYQFPTPLNAPRMMDPTYAQQHQELFGAGWVCIAPSSPPLNARGQLVGSQSMFVAVEWFGSPLVLPNGQRLVWFGIGHCRGDIAIGRVNTGDRVCTSWDSGVRFENNGIVARAAHCHLIGGTSTSLSMNGDVDALIIAKALGWQLEYRGAGGPGPNDYLGGGWIAGKPRTAWAGHSIPPVPSP